MSLRVGWSSCVLVVSVATWASRSSATPTDAASGVANGVLEPVTPETDAQHAADREAQREMSRAMSRPHAQIRLTSRNAPGWPGTERTLLEEFTPTTRPGA
jgi:hypothetical protein